MDVRSGADMTAAYTRLIIAHYPSIVTASAPSEVRTVTIHLPIRNLLVT